jgi:hypothetical protein
MRGALLILAVAVMAAEPCRNLAPSSNWTLPPFAKLEEGSAVVVEGRADGAIAQLLERPAGLAGGQVVAIGYARVESAHAIEATDDDVTPRLWEGAISLVNGYMRWLGGFESIYVQMRFTGREAASGAWKRFVSPPMPVWKARRLYPHFAFWGARLAPGVRVHLAGLALVEPADTECAGLPAPSPVLASLSQRQWNEDRKPDGAFDENFRIAERAVAGDPAAVELVLAARYRQGENGADRFLVAITQDGSDPRLSPTSQVTTILARRGADEWETTVRLKKGAGPLRIAAAAAALTAGGLRAQAPVFPPAWQRQRL